MEREQSEKNMDTLVNFSNRFVSCLKKYFWINEKMVMKVCKNNTTYWNPDALLFHKPKDRPHLEIKKNIEIRKEVSSRAEDYNTPENAQINTVAGTLRLHSEEPLIMAIKSLSYYLEKDHISSEILLDCVDLMIEGLTELSKDINTDTNVDNVLNELQRFHASKMNQHYGTNANYEKKRYDDSFRKKDVYLTPPGLYLTLFRISEYAPNGDKVKFYINTIFIRLILTRYVNVLENNQIPFYKFFNDIKKEAIDKDKIVLHKFREFFSNEKMEIDENDEIDAKKFLLSCDIDFWLRIINYVGNNKEEYKNLNPGKQDYMDTITYRLKYYRNVVSHLGDNNPSGEMVVRTLKTLCEFADNCGLELDSLMLSKHLVFEQYCCYVKNSPYPIKHRDDMDFTNFQFPKMETVPCWKDVVSPIVDYTKKIEMEEGISIPNLLFGDTSFCDNIFAIIKDFYINHKIALPYIFTGVIRDIKSNYPFHPYFFELISELKKEEQLELARRAIEKAYNDDNYSNPLIMPYEIDIDYEPIYNLLVEKFSTADFNGQKSDLGWTLSKYYLFHLNEEVSNYVEGNTDEVLEVIKVILLLNLRELFDKKKREDEIDVFLSIIIPDKERIRLNCYKPGKDVTIYEKALKIVQNKNGFIEYRKRGFWDKSSNAYCFIGLYNILFIEDKKINNHVDRYQGFKVHLNALNRKLAKVFKEDKSKTFKDLAVKIMADSGWESIEDVEKSISAFSPNEEMTFSDLDSVRNSLEKYYLGIAVKENRKDRIRLRDYLLYLYIRNDLMCDVFDVFDE